MSFKGLDEKMLAFLIENRLNDSKTWFYEHKTEYDEHVLKPFKQLVSELSENMLKIDPLFNVTPAVTKTISRIYRDTRYTKDKSIYRDNVWIYFTRSKKIFPDYPAFYFEVYPTCYRYGMGYYIASKEAMQTYRDLIKTSDSVFMKALECYEGQDTFRLLGDKYKRTLDPSKPENIRDWYDRKSVYFEHSSTDLGKVFTYDIVPELIEGFNKLAPIYQFLCCVEDLRPR